MMSLDEINILRSFSDSNIPDEQKVYIPDELKVYILHFMPVDSLLKLMQVDKYFYKFIYENIMTLGEVRKDFIFAKIALYIHRSNLIRNKDDSSMSNDEVEQLIAQKYFASIGLEFKLEEDDHLQSMLPVEVIRYIYNDEYNKFRIMHFGRGIIRDEKKCQDEFDKHIQDTLFGLLSSAKKSFQNTYAQLCSMDNINDININPDITDGFVYVQRTSEYERIGRLMEDINNTDSITITDWSGLRICGRSRYTHSWPRSQKVFLGIQCLIILFLQTLNILLLVKATMIEFYLDKQSQLYQFLELKNKFIEPILSCAFAGLSILFFITFVATFIKNQVRYSITYMNAVIRDMNDDHKVKWQALLKDTPSIETAYPNFINTMRDVLAALQHRKQKIINDIDENPLTQYDYAQLLAKLDDAINKIANELTDETDLYQRETPPWDNKFQQPLLGMYANKNRYILFRHDNYLSERKDYVSIDIHDSGVVSAGEDYPLLTQERYDGYSTCG